MSDRTKRILLVVALLAVTALLAFALYYLFKKAGPLAGILPTPTATPTVPGGLPPSGGRVTTTLPSGEVTTTLPVAGYIPGVQPSYYRTEAVTKITNTVTTYPSLAQNGNYRYYDATDGKFYRILPDGTVKTLSDQAFYNVSKTTWANSADKAVLEYPDGSKIIYNFETQKQVTIPKHWEDFSFSADSKEVAAKAVGLSPENRWLVTINDDGSGTKLVEPMGENQDKVIVDWSPSKQAVAFALTARGIGMYRKEIFFVGLNGENFKSTIVEGLGFEPKWSPTGKKLAYSVYSDRSDFKPELWVVNSYGQEIGSGRQNLGLATWAEKCTFSGDSTMYCAVPRTLPQGAGIKPGIAAGTTDDLYKIDLITGLKTTISTGGDYSINNLSVDDTNNRLLFTDPSQSGVFEVKL
ncbi:MAG: hypothetical protein NTW66_00270 [Candidatus Magasanikbacteria bacterium]|nr:hypothetical protein [Candidatus Magasanikbacteria bacterium]